MPNTLARPFEATVHTSPKFAQQPVKQPARRGRLPRAIPRIPTILREQRFAEFLSSRQTEQQRRDDLEEALSQDYIRIVRNPDGTRTVSLAGWYMDDHEYAAEALWDVLKEFEQRFDVRPPQARPSQRVLRLCDEELKHG